MSQTKLLKEIEQRTAEYLRAEENYGHPLDRADVVAIVKKCLESYFVLKIK